MSTRTGCRVLGVSESGFYDRRPRSPSQRSIRHSWPTGPNTEIHQCFYGAHGSRQVHAELRPGRGIVVEHGAIAPTAVLDHRMKHNRRLSCS
ncbi:hypothetical protein [Nocardia brevicatena]|uniref:hypothetical protein n=1 Tax=Nocardia brevicatena TaxID=37327 RepID=UPI001C3F18BA|nr:hypothetical protein [Nocardia brevicatena]